MRYKPNTGARNYVFEKNSCSRFLRLDIAVRFVAKPLNDTSYDKRYNFRESMGTPTTAGS